MQKIRTIHILKNKLGLSDDEYRAMLFQNYKKSSSKDLTEKQQSQLIYILNSQVISTQQANHSSYKQQNYIVFLAKGNVDDLTAFCSKILKRSITSINQLTKSEAIKIIDTLKRYHKGA